MSPQPPMPPEIAQQASPQGAQSVFMSQNLGPQPEMMAIQGALQSIDKMEKAFDDVVLQVKGIQPALAAAAMGPIGQIMMDLRGQLKRLMQRSGAAMGSPVMPPTPSGNPGAGPPPPGGASGVE